MANKTDSRIKTTACINGIWYDTDYHYESDTLLEVTVSKEAFGDIIKNDLAVLDSLDADFYQGDRRKRLFLTVNDGEKPMRVSCLIEIPATLECASCHALFYSDELAEYNANKKALAILAERRESTLSAYSHLCQPCADTILASV